MSSGCWVRCSLPQPFSVEISFRKNIQPTFSTLKMNEWSLCVGSVGILYQTARRHTTEECVANYLKSWRSSRKCINFQFLRCRSVTASYDGRSELTRTFCVYTCDVRLFHTSSGMTWRHRNWLLCSFKRSRITASGTFCFIAASSFEAGRVYLHNLSWDSRSPDSTSTHIVYKILWPVVVFMGRVSWRCEIFYRRYSPWEKGWKTLA